MAIISLDYKRVSSQILVLYPKLRHECLVMNRTFKMLRGKVSTTKSNNSCHEFVMYVLRLVNLLKCWNDSASTLSACRKELFCYQIRLGNPYFKNINQFKLIICCQNPAQHRTCFLHGSH